MTVAPGGANTGTANGEGVGTFQPGDCGTCGTFNFDAIDAGQQFIAFHKVDSSTRTLVGTATGLLRAIVGSTLISANDDALGGSGSTPSMQDATTLRSDGVGINVGNTIEQQRRTTR